METLCNPEKDFGKSLCKHSVVKLKSAYELREEHLDHMHIGCLGEVVRITSIQLNEDQFGVNRLSISFQDDKGSNWGGLACHVHSIISCEYKPPTNINKDGNLVP